jgi:hypothetical protein
LEKDASEIRMKTGTEGSTPNGVSILKADVPQLCNSAPDMNVLYGTGLPIPDSIRAPPRPLGANFMKQLQRRSVPVSRRAKQFNEEDEMVQAVEFRKAHLGQGKLPEGGYEVLLHTHNRTIEGSKGFSSERNPLVQCTVDLVKRVDGSMHVVSDLVIRNDVTHKTDSSTEDHHQHHVVGRCHALHLRNVGEDPKSSVVSIESGRGWRNKRPPLITYQIYEPKHYFK